MEYSQGEGRNNSAWNSILLALIACAAVAIAYLLSEVSALKKRVEELSNRKPVVRTVHVPVSTSPQDQTLTRLAALKTLAAARTNRSQPGLKTAVEFLARQSPKDLSKAQYQDAKLSGARLIGLELQGVNLIGADLSNADLTRTDFTHANLQGANLRGARLGGTKFKDANLRNSILTQDRNRGLHQGLVFTGANMSGADVSGITFQGCRLEAANFSGAKMIGTRFHTGLTNVDFSGADLTGAYFQGGLLNCRLDSANLTRAFLNISSAAGTTWTNANLFMTRFHYGTRSLYVPDIRSASNHMFALDYPDHLARHVFGTVISSQRTVRSPYPHIRLEAFRRDYPMRLMDNVDLAGADLSGIKLQSGIFAPGIDLRKLVIHYGALREMTLAETLLQGADFSYSSISRTSFQKAAMNSVSFANCGLTGVNLDGADMKDANFVRARLGKSSFKPMGNAPIVRDSSMRGTKLAGADFTEATVAVRFDDADLTKAKFDGAVVRSVFRGAQLTEASFDNANLENSDFRGAKGISAAQFKEATNVHLANFDLGFFSRED